MLRRVAVLTMIELLGACAHSQTPALRLAWRVVADMPLPGPAERFDYQSFDPTTGRLWIAHMGAGEVLAVDVRTRQVAARVPNMAGVTGIRAVPMLQRVFAALSGSREVAVLDAPSGRVVARVPGGRFPDGLAYAPAAHKVFVSDEHGRQELVIDVASSAARPPIALGGQVGNTQYDSASGHIWVAVQTRDELAVIDPLTDSVVARVPVPGVEGPPWVPDRRGSPPGVRDRGGERDVAVLDLRSMRVVRTYPVGEDPDVLDMDPKRRRLYVAAESGVIAAFEIHGDSLVALPRYRGACPLNPVDPTTDLVYVPLQDVDGRPVLRILTLEKR